LLESLQAPDELARPGRQLTEDYVVTRYPDIGEFAPYEAYGPDDSRGRIAAAEQIIAWTRAETEETPDGSDE
jgi:HEPN domain-containing protein